MNPSTFPELLQHFFTDRLRNQMEASPNTIAGYRDTFRLFLRFAGEKHGKSPTKLRVEDLDAELVGDFLLHVETSRRNSARSRNIRLAAIRSFFRYVAMSEPAYMLHCQRILAMPSKRYIRRTVDFLDQPEIEALLKAPDRTTWVGRRDHLVLLMALQTGLRSSELVNLRRLDAVLGVGAHIRCEGKGRKQRCTPLRQETAKLMELWLKEHQGAENDPLFPTIRGDRMSRDAFEHIVHKYTLSASVSCGFFYNSLKITTDTAFKMGLTFLPLAVLLQATIGIFTLLHCVGHIPVFWGVLHQAGAMILIAVTVFVIFHLFSTETKAA